MEDEWRNGGWENENERGGEVWAWVSGWFLCKLANE
jgi:hypothetical protein